MTTVLRKAYFRAHQMVQMMFNSRLPWRKPRLVSGAGCAGRIAEAVTADGCRHALIVTGPNIRKRGLPDKAIAALEAADIECTVFDSVPADPTVSSVEAAYSAYTENGCDCFVAIGGGSPMDCAKVAAARVARPNKSVSDMAGILGVRRKMPLLYAVPTTAGTGSEATIAAVVTDDVTHRKFTVTDPVLMPWYAFLDPELTLSLPPAVTAATGMDTLTHAVEAYINLFGTGKCRELASAAVKTVFENLEAVVADGSDIERRGAMLTASYNAGAAIALNGVGNVHAIAHTIGGLYRVAHGEAVAVALPHVLEEYGSAVHGSLARLAEAAGLVGENDAAKANAFIAAIRTLNGRFGLPDFFEMICDEDIPAMARWAEAEANPTYPVPVIWTRDAFESVIRRVRGDKK